MTIEKGGLVVKCTHCGTDHHVCIERDPVKVSLIVQNASMACSSCGKAFRYRAWSGDMSKHCF